MTIERNVGARDRAVRLSVAAALLLASVVLLELRAVGLLPISAGVGLAALLTAITGHSPLYAVLGISTLGLTRVASTSR